MSPLSNKYFLPSGKASVTDTHITVFTPTSHFVFQSEDGCETFVAAVSKSKVYFLIELPTVKNSEEILANYVYLFVCQVISFALMGCVHFQNEIIISKTFCVDATHRNWKYKLPPIHFDVIDLGANVSVARSEFTHSAVFYSLM